MLLRNVFVENYKNKFLLHLKNKIKVLELSSCRSYDKKDHCFRDISEEGYLIRLGLTNNEYMILQKADRSNTVTVIDRLSKSKE